MRALVRAGRARGSRCGAVRAAASSGGALSRAWSRLVVARARELRVLVGSYWSGSVEVLVGGKSLERGMQGGGKTFDDRGPLPPGWKTRMQNLPFYYNRAENLDSWNRPKFEAGSGPSAPSTTSDDLGPLPPGWKSRMQDRPFYYNRAEGLTSWNRPKFEDGSGPSAPSTAEPSPGQRNRREPQPVARGQVKLLAEPDVEAQMPPRETLAVSVSAAVPSKRTEQGPARTYTLHVKTFGALAKHLNRTDEVEIRLSKDETLRSIKTQVKIQLLKKLETGDAVQDKKTQQDLAEDHQRIYVAGSKLDSRTTVKDIIEKQMAAERAELAKIDSIGGLKEELKRYGAHSQEFIDRTDDMKTKDQKEKLIGEILNCRLGRGIEAAVDTPANLLGCHQGSCVEWSCCCLLFSLGVVMISSLVAIGSLVLYAPEDVKQFQHYLFIGAFFGVIGSCSMVLFIAQQLPRYTEKRGVWWNDEKLDRLHRETWIWSFSLNGKGAYLKVVIAFWLSTIKFAQLFTLTYEPEAISGLPKWAITVGEYTLFNFEKLLENENSTANVAIGDVAALGQENNLTQAATQALLQGYDTVTGFVTGEDAYQNYFILYSCICAAVLFLVCACWGCLNGRGSESMERKATMIVGTIQGFVAIPIYTHLLAGLDCTYEETGHGPYLNESGFRWDGATDAFGFSSDAQLQAGMLGDQTVERDVGLISEEQAKASCYGEWGPPSEIENWTAFNYMIFGMVAICIFHWPVTLFLMAKNDSERDDNEAVALIVDAVIRHSRLAGREITPQDPQLDGYEDIYEANKKCCKARQRKKGYENKKIVYVPGSAAYDFYQQVLKKQEVAGKTIIVPAMNRVEVRKYAIDHNVPQKVIDAIDHRHAFFWQVRDLDNAEDGVKGPRKRPREAAINFGMEIAIVVISALLSGNGTVSGVFFGSQCTWTDGDHMLAKEFDFVCGQLLTEGQCTENGQLIEEGEVDRCVWADRPLTVMEAKLACLACLHLMMAYYFWCENILAETFACAPTLAAAVSLLLPGLNACLRLLQQSNHSTLR